MGNMSYCRFENTTRDLQDCIDALNNYDDEMLYALSSYEIRALKDLKCQIDELVDLKDTIDSIIEMREENS